MDAMKGFRALAAAAAVVALAAGCAGPDVFPLEPATHPHVQLSCPLISAMHYDPADIPLADVDGVYICTSEPWTPAPDGTPQRVQYVDRVEQDDVPDLLDAYTAADAPPTDDNCIMSLQDPLIVWIHVGEQITPVYAPRDGCGFPSSAAADAYHAVGLHRLLVAREKETHD